MANSKEIDGTLPLTDEKARVMVAAGMKFVQAKRYSKNVGIDTIHQVVDTRNHYGASGS